MVTVIGMIAFIAGGIFFFYKLITAITKGTSKKTSIYTTTNNSQPISSFSMSESNKKTLAMDRAIRAELSNCSREELLQERYLLYDFMTKYNEGAFAPFYEDISFENFCKAIDYMKSINFTYGKYGDYMPIAAFCFLKPLAFVYTFFDDNRTQDDEELALACIYAYFENN